MAFFALPIPTAVQAQLVAGLSALQQKWPQVHWVHPEDYHITLRFLGGLQGPELSKLVATVKRLPFRPFTLDLQGLSSFPAQRDRGVLWLALQEIAPALIDLQQGLEQEVQSLGFVPETKPYAPHLTIGRFKAADAAPIMEALPAWAERRWAQLSCREYVLMKRRSGARNDSALPLYEVLAQFPV